MKPEHIPAPSIAPRWRRRKEARPTEILQAALEMFVEHGFAATKLDDVAQRAGVTKGTVYLYYANKEELLKSVVVHAVMPLIDHAELLVHEYEGTTADLLRTLVRSMWASLKDSPVSGIEKLVIAESSNFPDLARFYMQEVVMRARQLFANVLERGIERNEFRPLPIDSATREIFYPLIFVSIWTNSLYKFEPKSTDLTEYIETHLDILLRGIAK